MRKIYYSFLLLALLACGKKTETASVPVASEPAISETISDTEFQQKLATTSDAVLLDVRTPEEVANGYIEGAVNVDFRASDFEGKLKELKKDATYFVYCGSGGRSRQAADLMRELDFKKVYDLKGGISAWRADGLPVVQSEQNATK